MFNGQEKKRIEELEAELAETKRLAKEDLDRLGQSWHDDVAHLTETHSVELATLRSEHAAKRLDDAKLHNDEKRALIDAHADDIATYNLRIAEINGQLTQSEKAALKWWRLANGWRFHKGGSVEVEGVLFNLYEARTDNPLINIRVLIPQEETFP